MARASGYCYPLVVVVVVVVVVVLLLLLPGMAVREKDITNAKSFSWSSCRSSSCEFFFDFGEGNLAGNLVGILRGFNF